MDVGIPVLCGANCGGGVMEQMTVCEYCGTEIPHISASWTDDGASYCEGCIPRESFQSEITRFRAELAAEKALADGLWVSFLEYRKRLRRAAYDVVVAADKAEDAYRKAREQK